MDYLIGYGIGIFQTIIGYPFDTIKTTIQNRTSNSKSLLKGLKFSLYGNVISNAFLFGNFDRLENDLGYSLIIGGVTGILITPFEVKKISNQCSTVNKNIFSGICYTVTREMLAVPLYFNTYRFLRLYGMDEFLAGGCTGVITCLAVYPIDTLKSREQGGKSQIKFDKLYKGVGVSLFRAFFVNSISFYLYGLYKTYR